MMKHKQIDLTKEESEKLQRDNYVWIERDGFTFLVKKGIFNFKTEHDETLTAFLINHINYSKDIKNDSL